jgi:hypothetical protein
MSGSGTAAVARDAEWLPHRYDPIGDAIHFVHAPRDTHRRATFLTDEFLPGSNDPVAIKRADAVLAAAPPAPLHFILHSAFCCSTLVARACDLPGAAMALKEPVILNDLIGWKRRGGDPARIAQALDHALRMLERPFAPGEKVLIKPSNVVNAFAPAMLAMRPHSHALIMYAPLRTFIASIAKKGMHGRLWVRDLLVKLLSDGLVDLGFSGEDYLRHTDLQAAAVGWLAQQALFNRLIKQHGPLRIRTVDSETLVARPEEAMVALAHLFGLGIDEARAKAIAKGPAFQRHSKTDADFGAEQRRLEERSAVETHGDEIDKVCVWAELVAKGAGLPLTLGAPLLP